VNGAGVRIALRDSGGIPAAAHQGCDPLNPSLLEAMGGALGKPGQARIAELSSCDEIARDHDSFFRDLAREHGVPV
jgi:hypothetical protein